MAHFKITSGIRVDVFPSHFTTEEIIQEEVGRSDKEDPFYVVDLGKLIHLYKHVSYQRNQHAICILCLILFSGTIYCPQ